MNTQKNKKLKITFVEVLNAGVVQWLCYDLLQAVLAAGTAGIHFHITEAQLLQVNTHIQHRSTQNVWVETFFHSRLRYVWECWEYNILCVQTDLTDQGSCGGLPNPRRSREQSSFVSWSIIFPSSKFTKPCSCTVGKISSLQTIYHK